MIDINKIMGSITGSSIDAISTDIGIAIHKEDIRYGVDHTGKRVEMRLVEGDFIRKLKVSPHDRIGYTPDRWRVVCVWDKEVVRNAPRSGGTWIEREEAIQMCQRSMISMVNQLRPILTFTIGSDKSRLHTSSGVEMELYPKWRDGKDEVWETWRVRYPYLMVGGVRRYYAPPYMGVMVVQDTRHPDCYVKITVMDDWTKHARRVYVETRVTMEVMRRKGGKVDTIGSYQLVGNVDGVVYIGAKLGYVEDSLDARRI